MPNKKYDQPLVHKFTSILNQKKKFQMECQKNRFEFTVINSQFLKCDQLCEFDKFKVKIKNSSQIHNFTQRKKESSKFHSEIQSNSLNSHNLNYSF